MVVLGGSFKFDQIVPEFITKSKSQEPYLGEKTCKNIICRYTIDTASLTSINIWELSQSGLSLGNSLITNVSAESQEPLLTVNTCRGINCGYGKDTTLRTKY